MSESMKPNVKYYPKLKTIARMHVYMPEYSITLWYYLYQIIKKIIREPDIEKSGSWTFKNIKSDQKCQVRTNTNFAVKCNRQTYLSNDKYNDPKPEMCMFKPLV